MCIIVLFEGLSLTCAYFVVIAAEWGIRIGRIHLPSLRFQVCTTKPKADNIDKKTKVSKGLKRLKRRIDDEYRGHLILDNLPVSEVYV